MLRKWNRFLAFVLTIALVTTSFGSDFASATAYAVEDAEDLEARAEEGTWSEIIEETNNEESTVTETVAEEPEAEPEVTDAAEEVTVFVQPEDQPAEGSADVDVAPEEPGEEQNEEEQAADAADTEDSSDETPEEEAVAEATEEAAAEASEVIEEKLVTVTYKAGKGGKVVGNKTETVNINDPDAAFEGATAEAYKNYQFLAWVDEDEKPVSTDSTFVPSDVTEDATFTATFIADENIEELMPAIRVSDFETDGLIVSIEAEVGVFPAGTTVKIEAISDELAVEMAEKALGTETNKQAKGVDITFFDEDKNEIQPNDRKYVHVSLKPAENDSIEGESFTVLHEHEGEVKEIDAAVTTADANNDPDDNTQVATKVTFDVNEFSIFIVVGEDEENPSTTEFELGTIRFYNKPISEAADGDIIFEKIVKNGDEIANPGVPYIGANQEFLGWYIDGDTKKTEIKFTDDKYVLPEGEDALIIHDCEINVYPVMSTTYYVTFIGSDGEIARVERVPVVNPEDAILDVTASKYDIPAGAGRAFKGWSRENKEEYTDEDIITSEDPLNVVAAAQDGEIFLYAVIVDAFWIRFKNNVGNEKGATYTDSQFLEENDPLDKVFTKLTDNQMPTRTGYTFLGWSLSDASDRQVLTDTEKAILIQDVPSLDTDKNELFLYACWAANSSTKYTVIEWHQNLTLDGWDYYSSKELEGTTDAEIIFTESTQGGREYISVKTDNAADRDEWKQYENTQTHGDNNDAFISDDEDKNNEYIQAGFEYNTALESEVKIEGANERDGKFYLNASGNTVVNIYEVRREITIEFQYRGSVPYTYTPTTSNNGTQYGIVNGNYVQLTKYNNRWYYSGNYNWHEYTGTRYTRSGGGTDWVIYTNNGTFPGTFTGRYGQKFTDVNAAYKWPSEKVWREGRDGNSASGTIMTFLDSFLLNWTYYSSSDSSTGCTIRHYKQNIDGTYNLDVNLPDQGCDNSATTSASGNFHFNDKYNGFAVAKYSYNLNNNPNTWSTCMDEDYAPTGTTTSVGLSGHSTLYVLHERKNYNVTFKIINSQGNITETKIVTGVPYEQVLNNVKAVTDYRDEDRELTGYSFNWYKNPEGDPEGDSKGETGDITVKDPEKLFDFSTKMPDGGVVIYGIYEPVNYKVTLKANGGTFVNDLAWMQNKPEAERCFNVLATEEVGRNTLITGIEQEGFELIDWYIADKDGKPTTKFNYGKITGPVTLIAVWRNQGTVRVWYDTDAEKGAYKNGDTEFIPDYDYATNSSVVLAAPPTGKSTEETSYSFIGWKVLGEKEDNIYLPNGVFTIDTDIYGAGVYKTVDDKTYWCVHVVAQYIESGTNGGKDEKTEIKYDPNGGQLKADTGETLVNGQVVVPDLLVNQKVIAKDAIFEKTGFVQVGWNTDPSENPQGLAVKFGEEIAADLLNRTDKNTVINTLYAVYEPIKLYVVIQGSDKKVTYNGEYHDDDDYSIKEAYYYEGNDPKAAKIDASDLISKDDIIYSGSHISEKDVRRDSDNNVIPYTYTMAYSQFAKKPSVKYDVRFSLDSDNNQLKLTINPVTVTVTTGSDSKEYDGTALTNSEASISELIGNDSATVSATGSIIEVGTDDNTYRIVWASGTNPANYEIEEQLGTLEITAREITLIAASDNKTYDGTPLTNSGVTAENLPKGFTLVAEAEGSATNVDDEGKNVVKDGWAIKNSAGQTVTGSFTLKEKKDGTLTITPAPLTISTGSDSKPYDGTPLTCGDVTKTGLFDCDKNKVTVTVNGSITDVDDPLNGQEGNNTFDVVFADTVTEHNYDLTKTPGTLTVTASDIEVVLTAASDNKTYDGEPLTNAGVTESGLPEGFTYEAEAEGSALNYGDEGKNVVKTGYKFFDKTGKDVTAFFKADKISTVDGKLTINKAPLTVTTKGARKPYDGTPLTKKDEWTIKAADNAGELVDAEVDKLKLDITTSITNVGTIKNDEYTINWTEAGVNADNYAITEVFGDLEVYKNDVEITIKAASQSKTYDGTALENHTVTADGLPTGLKVVGTTTGSVTNVSDNPAENIKNNIIVRVGTDACKIVDGNNKDVTGYFSNVTYEDGVLTIDPAALTVTTGSAEKPYDGTALTKKDGYSVDGLVNNETVKLNITGSQTDYNADLERPIRNNTAAIVWAESTAEESNYSVTYNFGDLVITKTDTTVTLTAPSAEKYYDGTALTADGKDAANPVKWDGLPDGYTVVATASGSALNYGDEGKNVVDDGYVIYDKAGQDVTDFYTNVDKVDGKLTIKAITVYVETYGKSREYDGTPLTMGGKVTVKAGDEIIAETPISDDHGNAPVEVTLANNEKVNITLPESITDFGKVTNTYEWSSALSGNYSESSSKKELEITKYNTEVTITAPSKSKTYDGTALTADGSEAAYPITWDGLPEGFTVVAKATGSATNVADTAADNNPIADDYQILDANNKPVSRDNFATISLVAGKLTIEKCEISVVTRTDSKAYDGTPLTMGADITVEGVSGTQPIDDKHENAAQIINLVNGEQVSIKVTGSQTAVGTSDNKYDVVQWIGADSGNYKFKENTPGTLTVTANSDEILIYAPGGEKDYDGTPLTVPVDKDHPVTWSDNLPAGFTVEAVVSGTITNVGEEDNVITSYKIWNGNVEVTGNYTKVTKVPGTLKINKRKVTIDTRSKEREYNGEPLTMGADIVIDQVEGSQSIEDEHNNAPAEITLMNGEKLSITITGKETEVNETTDHAGNNTYTINWNASTADEANYDITVNKGTLTIKKSTSTVTLTAPSDEKVYDGTPLTADGRDADKPVTWTGLPDGFKVVATASGSALNYGDEGKNVVDDGYIIYDANNKVVTGFYTTVKKEDGKLTIKQVDVHIKTNGDTKEYDGTPLIRGGQVTVGTTITPIPDTHNNEAVSIDLVGKEKLKITITGSVTDVNVNDDPAPSKNNKYVLDWGKVLSTNYNVIDDDIGTLIVTANESNVITLTAPSAEKYYDGKALTADGTDAANPVTWDGLPDGFTVAATASGSATNVGDKGENVVNDGYIIYDTENHDVTDFYTKVEKVDGKLTIKPITVYVETYGKSREYDGTPLTMGGKVTVKAGDEIIAETPISDDHGNAAVEVTLANNEKVNITLPESITDFGKVTNTYEWSSALSGNYSESSDTKELEITKYEKEITITAPSRSKEYDGTALTADGSDKDYPILVTNLPTDFTVVAKATGSATNVADTKDGNNPIADDYEILDANRKPVSRDNFDKITTVAGTLTITKKDVTITIASHTKPYDGTPLTMGATVKVDNRTINIPNDHENKAYKVVLIKNGDEEVESVQITLPASVLEVGDKEVNDCTFTWSDDKQADNYNIVKTPGSIEIIKNTETLITFTAPSATKFYDGAPLTADGNSQVETEKVAASGLPESFTYEATATGSITNVGTEDNVVDSYTIYNANHEDRTDSFTNIKTFEGTLKVEPRKVTINTGSGEQEYNGKALTKGAIVTIDDVEGEQKIADDHKNEPAEITLMNGEKIKVTITGTQTEVNEDTAHDNNNTYDIEWTTAAASNYEIEGTKGTLTVKKNQSEIVVTAPSAEKVYDGKELTADGTDADNPVTANENLPEGFTVTAVMTGKITDVEETAEGNNPIQENSIRIFDASGADVTDSFANVKGEAGTLTITKAPVHITTKGETRKYNGDILTKGAIVQTTENLNTIDDAHKNQAVSITLINGETAKITLAKSVRTVQDCKDGAVKNTYAIAWETAKPSNYELIDDSIGELLITGRGDDAYIVKASTDDVNVMYKAAKYDGFDYKLTPVSSNPLVQAFNTVVGFLGNLFSFVSGATDATTQKTITVDGHEYTVSGIYVETSTTDTEKENAKDAGTYPMLINLKNVVVKDDAGNEVQDQFKFVEDSVGKLNISKVPVLVKTEGRNGGVYSSGKKVTNPNASISVNGVTVEQAVQDELAKVTVVGTGVLTKAGKTPNTYDITWPQGVKAANYEISEDLGILSMTAPSTPDPGPTPDPTPTPTPTTTPAGAVLGARREDAATNEAAVLGARRGRTDDTTADSTSRVFAIVLSAAVAITLILKGKKKEEEN